MTAREMIDSLSGTLLCDERILSVPERGAACQPAAAYEKPGERPGQHGSRGHYPYCWRNHRRTSAGSAGRKHDPATAPAAVGIIYEFSKPQPATDPRRIATNHATSARARITSARYKPAAHKRRSATSYSAATRARIASAGHQSAAHLVLRNYLAAADGKNRCP